MGGVLSASEFARALPDPAWAEETARNRPVVVVEVGRGQPIEVPDVWPATPLIVVGLADRPDPAPAWADVVIGADDEATLDALLNSIERGPRASTALALLLRHSENRSVADALVAESTTYSMLQAGPEFTEWRAATPVAEADDDDTRVEMTRHGDRLEIVMVRTSRANAIDLEMRDALAEALQLAVLDESVATVELRGAGPSFSTGGDLDTFGRFADVVDSHVVRLLRSPAALAARVAPRLTSHIHGACIGGGVELAAFADRVIAEPTVAISLPEVGLGLIPGAGGTASIPRRIGRHRTALLGLSGITIDGPTALDWGLVDELTN